MAEEKEIKYFDEIPTKGRNKKILNDAGKRMVEKLAGMMCTDEEIASVIDLSVDTLTNKNNIKAFTEHKKRGQDKGKASLRRCQYEAAQKGNVTMLIWLGKQYLGQTEKQETTVSDDREIKFIINPASTAPKEMFENE